MVTWNPIPRDSAHGIIKLYEVQLEGTSQRVFSCSNNLNIVIPDLEKSKVYKLRIAGYTSKGRGNFSEYVIVTTNIGGKLLNKLGHPPPPPYRFFFFFFSFIFSNAFPTLGSVGRSEKNDFPMIWSNLKRGGSVLQLPAGNHEVENMVAKSTWRQ